MLNNAGERSEPRKFCIFNHQMWGKGEIRTLFLFFADFKGGGGERPFHPLWIRHCRVSIDKRSILIFLVLFFSFFVFHVDNLLNCVLQINIIRMYLLENRKMLSDSYDSEFINHNNKFKDLKNLKNPIVSVLDTSIMSKH